MKKQSALGLAILVLSLFLFLTCNDDGGGGEGGTSRETIGPEGGEITSADGRLTLTFPPDAFSEDTEITIREINPEDLPPEFDGLDPEFAYVLEPDGIEFAVPVTATLMLDEEPVQDDGSLETEFALLITSSDGELEVLENLSREVDEDANMTTVSGELSHFSPLVARESASISGVIIGVPDSLPVGGTFNAVATVSAAQGPGNRITGSSYIDNSTSPVIPQFDADTTQQLPTIIDDNDLQVDQGIFPYLCSPEGTGRYRALILISGYRVRFTRSTGELEFEFEGDGYNLVFSKGVTCFAVTPAPTPVPQPSPGPGPSPSPSPTPTPEACVMPGVYTGNGGCGVNSLTISRITGDGNLLVDNFADNPGTLTFDKTDDPNVFESVRTDIIIFGVSGHSCTITCGPGTNQFTLECTRPGAVCQKIFTLQ
jgi:hypothetical protein